MLKNIYRNNLLSKRRGKLRIRKRKLARYPVTSSTRSLIPVIIAQALDEGGRRIRSNEQTNLTEGGDGSYPSSETG